MGFLKLAEKNKSSDSTKKSKEDIGDNSVTDISSSHVPMQENLEADATTNNTISAANSTRNHEFKTKSLEEAVSKRFLQMDEFSNYGLYVANKLKNYSKNTRALVEHHISNILFDADMGEFDKLPFVFSQFHPNIVPSCHSSD